MTFLVIYQYDVTKNTCSLLITSLQVKTSRQYFFKLIQILKKIFTDIWPVADILLTTETEIPKFAYRYVCLYFNKVFWLQLVGTVYTSLVHLVVIFSKNCKANMYLKTRKILMNKFQ